VRRSAIAAFTTLLLLASATFVLAGCGDDSGPADSGPSGSSSAPSAREDMDGDGVPDAEDAAPDDASTGRDKAVIGSVKLERSPGGPADAGTQAGHQGGEALGTTNRPTFRFDGTVSPAEGEVTVTAANAAVSGRVRMVGDHGDFTVELSNLLRGANRFTLRERARLQAVDTGCCHFATPIAMSADAADLFRAQRSRLIAARVRTRERPAIAGSPLSGQRIRAAEMCGRGAFPSPP
jgi:hypothetical protein